MSSSSWTPTDILIHDLQLQKHPEGGYFAETDRQVTQVLSPFSRNEPRPLGTSIYYLLTKDSPSGVIHMNKSVTYHILHQGRAEYTLIYPTNPPTIEKHIIGTNVSAGESRQLLVGTGVWKMSRLLPEDMDHGCLITEVVVPGFHWEDHQFLTKGGLHELLENVKGEEKETIMKQLEKHVKGRGA
ncbi:RmlC-like cupin domain-containing protein [Lentinula edodes]|uniref:RmlC-like cupin domain-containing protein n=1 Tax=Lentinula edodes TaxID=5353 RepID=UPI001E8D3903|nr:RmlC-like cupin domain-containing protein [Lentinula edodes]KAH7881368.1 RmlC-like cupin domain-containing protein [Lentinula edodes]KAJ3920071.1 RmlC-like cupin domain-containing protein [Lentinula edodes]